MKFNIWLMVVCLSRPIALQAMQFVPAGAETLDVIGSNKTTVFIGLYQNQYLGLELLAAQEKIISISLLPDNVQAVLKEIGAGEQVPVAVNLWGKLLLDEGTRAVLIADDIPVPSEYPAHYNVIFHKMVHSWLPWDATKYDGLFVGALPVGGAGVFFAQDRLERNPVKQSNAVFNAGAFDAQGIKAFTQAGKREFSEQDIVLGFNELKMLPIHIHRPGESFSPDNGRFSPIAGRQFATFWLIGQLAYPAAQKAQNRIVVTYNLMPLDAEAYGELRKVIQQSRGKASALFIRDIKSMAYLKFRAIEGAPDANASLDNALLFAVADFLEKFEGVAPRAGEQKSGVETKAAAASAGAKPAAPVQNNVGHDLALLAHNLQALV